MKNFIKNFKNFTFVVAIIFLITACDLFKDDEPSYSFGGKWEPFSWAELNINEDNYTYSESPQTRSKGTFTYTATHITFNITHRESSSGWNETNQAGSWNWFIENETVPYNFKSIYNSTTKKNIIYLTINGKEYRKIE